MFNPKTEKIRKLSILFHKQVNDLESMFDAPTIIYIDWSNVFYWQKKLQWNIGIARLRG